MVAEFNSTNTTATMQYIVGDGTVLAQQAGTSAPARFLLHDGQGSTRSLFDNGGTLLENYVYDAFGTLKAPTGTPQTRYLYTGQQFDAATKLYSLRARYYAPTQGRFTSRDVAKVAFRKPHELNRYGYTANNPINGFDPSGHALEEEASLNINIEENLAPTTEVGEATEAVLDEIVVTQDEITATTLHGSVRLAQRGFTEADIALTKSGYTLTQSDGATVFIKEVTAGKFNVIVEGERGVITALKTISQRSLTRLATRYGWL